MGISDILSFLPVLGIIDSGDIEITTIPSWTDTVGDASVVLYDKEATAELFEEIDSQ